MSAEISLDDVKRRAQVAGLAIRDDRWESVRRLLADALKPLRALDSRAIAAVEPAATFEASGPSTPVGGGADERR